MLAQIPAQGCALLYSLAVCLAVTHAGRADDPAPTEPDHVATGSVLDRILPAISSPSAANLRIADQAWRSATPETGDVLARYALALAYAANNQHQKGFDLIEELPPEVRKAGPLRRTYIWLALKSKLDERARVGIQGMVENLKTRAAQPATAADLDDIEFVARIVTYLREIGEREPPLQKAQAEIWWNTLTALPESWQKEMLATQSRVIAAREKQQQELEKGFAPWRERTQQDLDAAVKKVADILDAEAKTVAEINEARNGLQMFEAQAMSQIQALQAQAQQLLAQRNGLPRPVPPSPPRAPTGRDKDDPRAMLAFERSVANYKDALVRFEVAAALYEDAVKKFNKQIAALEVEAMGVQQQIARRQNEFRIKEGTLKKVQGPLQLAVKNEERLRQLLTDRKTWDSPGSLATLRALDGYVTIDPAAEVARIQKARFKR